MELQKDINIIHEKLAILSTEINLRGEFNMYYIQTFFAELTNLIFGYQLKNINIYERNAKAIDLIDTENKIIVQVSSNNSKVKVQSSLDGIKEEYKKKNYHFIFISISREAAHLKRQSFKIPEGIIFDPKNDCFDNHTLITHIVSKGNECIKKVSDYLNETVVYKERNSSDDNELKTNIDGNELINKINQCPKGQEGWSQFEDIGIEVFSYLFADNFRTFDYDIQSTTNDKISRRDMVINNNYKESPCFWQLVKDDYGANLIIIDFKNYSNKLNRDQIFNTSKYMNKVAGNFVIVISRCGLNVSAEQEQLNLLYEKKLIISLSDTDLIDLINKKMKGQNPLDSLDKKYYTLCKKK